MKLKQAQQCREGKSGHDRTVTGWQGVTGFHMGKFDMDELVFEDAASVAATVAKCEPTPCNCTLSKEGGACMICPGRMHLW